VVYKLNGDELYGGLLANVARRK